MVGASEKFGAGSLVIDNLRTLGFSGEIIPVNPRYTEVLGLKCYPSLSDIPLEMEIDCAAVLLGAEQILPGIKTGCPERDSRGLGICQRIFRNRRSGRCTVQAELRSFCDENGIVLCGPNCVGYVNLHQKVGTFSAPISPTLKKGNVGAVVQSGSVALALANSGRGIGFSTLVSSGNEAVLDIVDYIEHFLQDDNTRLIITFLEGIRTRKRFKEPAFGLPKRANPSLPSK